MKKIMFIGSIGSGKTTLCQRVMGEDINYQKTQAAEFYSTMIDTPGEFVQHRRYYNALQTMAAEVEVIGLISSVIEEELIFAPNFALNFVKPCIGIVSKIDLCNDKEDIERAKERLKLAGVEEIFLISSVDYTGISDLVNYLNRR
jgi:ethanolamine utilization protein EutP